MRGGDIGLEFPVLGMRKFTAIFRTHRIDGTLVILAKMLARGFGVHPVAGFILVEILVLVLLVGHAQVLGDALDVGRFEGRRHDLAAMRAIQAVDLLESLLMQGDGQAVEPA